MEKAAVEKQNENKAFNERTRPRQFYRQILWSFKRQIILLPCKPLQPIKRALWNETDKWR